MIGTDLIQRMRWLNEPPRWSHADGVLAATSGNGTDFWQKTYYGFHRDDGHAMLADVAGGFSATLAFDGAYETL